MDDTVRIEKLAYGSEGIAHVGGKVCFVEGALPGEKVRIRITQDKKKFLRAETVEVLEPSPHRIEPACPYTAECGGCQYQHVDYAEELRWKEIQLRENVCRSLKLPEEAVRPIRAAEDPYQYRHSVTLHETVKNSPQAQVFGFVSRDNRSVIPVESCLLADPRLQEVFGKKYLLKKGEDSVAFRVSDKGMIFDDRKEQFFPLRVGDEVLLASSKGFFQNNLKVTSMITEQLAGWVREFGPGVFMDLYAGVGTFSLTAARSVSHLVCAEENPHSLEAFRLNLSERKMEAEILQGKVETTVPRYWKRKPPRDAMVFADPPRKGMEGGIAEFLAGKDGIKALVYLSCHAGTLIRDLGILTGGGKYEIREIIPFDMFPRTKHLEAMALLLPVKRG